MWSAITAVLQAIFGAIFGELFNQIDQPSVVINTPPPVLNQVNPGGVVDDDLVSRYHRVLHTP